MKNALLVAAIALRIIGSALLIETGYLLYKYIPGIYETMISPAEHCDCDCEE
jgi:hypothetical protein